ncbi:hypothetical protein QGM71_12550 [Virgibacillus sp. C22-A2]|uniref:DUF4304 domain-containing protein n=1 Tax=Virgibacillus tibetensis TaxID=3042313 RepID=A0ABU6KIR2_9BACI|nr:hypothetical protein [Virgibacillus sp. C22-A2]
MSTKMVVNKLDNGYESAIKAMKSGNTFICRLVNWSLILVNLNKVGTGFTVVYYDPLDMVYLDQNIDKATFHGVYEEMYKPVASEYFEVIAAGDVETVDDCERIIASLPIPENGANHEKIKKFLDTKKLKFPSRKASFVLFPKVTKEKSVTNKSLASVVIESLGDFIQQYVEYGENEITMEVRDVNAKINGKDLIDYIKGVLEDNGFDRENIRFFFGDGHWMTVYIK